MKTYRYTARDIKGALSKGTMNAEGTDEVYQKLKESGLFCVGLDYQEEEKEKNAGYRMRVRDVALFCRQLSAMLSAGLMVSKAMNILYDREQNTKIKASFLLLFEDIQKGLSLYEAMKEQGAVYPTLLVSMVHAGEMSGTLDSVMLKMSDHYEKEYRLLGKLRSSLAYPILLVIVTMLVMVGMFIFVLPSFFVMFEGAELPFITKMVMAISRFLTYQWYVPLVIILLLLLVWAIIGQRRGVRLAVDKMKLTFPILGKQMKIIYIARFTHALCTLYSSGIPMIEAVEMSAAVLNNSYISGKFVQVLSDITRGEMLSASIEKSGLFDTMVTSMIYIGEESGGLEKMLEKISSFYDNESETALQKMMSLFEPALLVIIALMIGTVVAAVILPIYGMYSTVV